VRSDAIASPSRQPALDWLNFFVANVQTGFGPFIAVYLTSEAWTQRDIGQVLSIGTFAAMLSQLPGGALVDALHNKRLAALAAALAIAASALIFAMAPRPLPVVIAEVLHGFASCMLMPAIAAISLQLVGRSGLGERLGRNARFSAIGSGVAAALLGACGTYVSERAVFYLTAALMLPGLACLLAIPVPEQQAKEVALPLPASAVGAAPASPRSEIRSLILDRRLWVFGLCVALFHLSNAALLPLAGAEVTKSIGNGANLVVAACIILPQIVVALLSPFVGRMADRVGRRIVLILGFLALPIRAVLLAVVQDPVQLVAVQALDGISGAAFGIMLPLIAADLTRGTSHFNLCMGALGLAVGAGATLSTALAGSVADQYSEAIAFLALAGAGMAAVLLVVLAMPETRPVDVLENELTHARRV
jgi:MFS family permease